MRLHEVILRDTRANQPLPADAPPGTLFYVTDESVLERNKDDQSAWESYSDAAGITDHGGLSGLGDDDHTIYTKADGSRAFTGDQSMGSHKLTNVTDPSSAQDAATKAYVDALALGVTGSLTVRAATTANVAIATALNNGDALDGVTLATGDLVLVKDQTAPEENGIYVVGASPARDAFFDTYNEHPGKLVVVQEGSTNADTFWYCTSNKGGTLNTTALVFSQLSTGGGITSLTGDVTGTGPGATATTIANDAVTTAKILNANVTPAKLSTAAKTRQIAFVIDGGGSVITTGAKKAYVTVPWACTITGNRVLGDQSGSIVLDVWKDSYANFPPTVADTITASAKPTLSSAQKSEDTALTGWTTSLSAGDVLEVNVDSVTTLTKVKLELTVVLS